MPWKSLFLRVQHARTRIPLNLRPASSPAAAKSTVPETLTGGAPSVGSQQPVHGKTASEVVKTRFCFYLTCAYTYTPWSGCVPLP